MIFVAVISFLELLALGTLGMSCSIMPLGGGDMQLIRSKLTEDLEVTS